MACGERGRFTGELWEMAEGMGFEPTIRG